MKKALLAIVLALSLGSSVSFAADSRDWRGYRRPDDYRRYGYYHRYHRYHHRPYWHGHDWGRRRYYGYDRPYHDYGYRPYGYGR